MKKYYILSIFIFLSIIHYGQAIQLDKHFGDKGVVVRNGNGNGNTLGSSSRGCFRISNNKVLLVAEFNEFVMISQRLPNGAIDSGYGKNGFSVPVVINQPVAAIQKDSKIVVAGTNGYSNSDFMLARFNTNGNLDASFGNGGVIMTDLGSNSDIPYAVTVQNDGKILAAGQTLVNGVSQFAIARYNSNGNPDLSFGNHGNVLTNLGNASQVNAIVLQPNNKIIAAGNYFNGTNGDFAIVRYNPNGSLDTGFNGTGKRFSDFGNSDNATATVITSDGKIIVGGYSIDQNSNSHFEIARYTTTGSLDLSFNGSGVTTANFGTLYDYLATLTLTIDGSILAGGYINTNTSQNQALAKFKPNGFPDSSFGNAGVIDPETPSGNNFLTNIVIRPDGKIVTAGSNFSFTSFLQSFTLSQFNSNGVPDPNFGTGGYVIGYYPGSAVSFNSIMQAATGKLIVSGSEASNNNFGQNFLTRYNKNGNIDKTYGNNGTANIQGAYVVAQTDGKVVNAGVRDGLNGTEIVMSRYNANGSIDAAYGNNGQAIYDFLGGNEGVGPTAIQTDNKVVTAGYIFNNTGSDILLARFNTDGTPDASFGTGGFKVVDIEQQDFIQTIAISTGGKILCGGYGYTQNFQLVATLSMFKSNGTLDSTFGQNGIIINNTPQEAFAGTVLFQNDGKIVFSYEISPDFNNFYSYVSRYNPDGNLDQSFGNNGTISVEGAGIVLTDDQKIIVAGRATDPQNYTINTIARFNANGTKDISFGNNGKIIISLADGNNIVASLLFNNNQLFEAGYCHDPNLKGLLAKFLLDKSGDLSSLNNDPLSAIDQVENADLFISTTPNPSHGSFTVKVKPSITNQPVELLLLTIDGKVIQHIEKIFPGQEAAIGTAKMPSGVYFLQVIRLGSTHTTKLLKY